MYDSLLGILGALYLDIFEQPTGKDELSTLLDTAGLYV
jgi:hypothetical protein